MAGFHDHFSGVSRDYQRYRPAYPPSLFSQLAALTPVHELAWDCAAGSGQAVPGLQNHFSSVVASDASLAQIQTCRVPGVHRFCSLAEAVPLGDNSVDLITVAQAAHWFDLERFYTEARRVLRPGGVLAIWTYKLLQSTPEVEEVVFRLHGETLGGDWPAQRQLVENGYRDLPFPFKELTLSPEYMSAQWGLQSLMGYLATWSAVGRYRKRTGMDPLHGVGEELERCWPRGQAKIQITWPVAMRVGRVE